MLALSFARSVSTMAFALRFSILPLLDSIMHSAFGNGVEDASRDVEMAPLSPAQEFDIERSAINMNRFTATKYWENELQRQKAKPRARKNPNS